MKALKIILVIVVLLAAAYFATSWYLSENLDRIVKEAVEKSGTKQLGSKIGLQSAKISIPKASARLSGLSVANPPGFSSDPVLTLGSIDVDIDIKSLADDVVVIEEITIVDPQVSFEMNSEGVSNLDVLEKKINKAGSGSSGDDETLLIIDRLDFKGGSIKATTALKPDFELVFDFPVIFMTDLGRPNGATADEIAAEVSAVLIERSMDAAKRAGVKQLVDEQTGRLEEKAREKLDEKLKDLLKRD